MKKLVVLCSILFLSCGTKQSTTDTEKTSLNISEMECPKPGKCSWEFMPNQSLIIKDNTGGTFYPQFVENSKTSVIKFRYHQDSPEGVADGQYTEEVYFEVENDEQKLFLKNEELQQVKLLYGRLCFCERGSVGYVKVNEGQLKYSKQDNKILVSLDFENNQIPQVLKELQGIVDLQE